MNQATPISVDCQLHTRRVGLSRSWLAPVLLVLFVVVPLAYIYVTEPRQTADVYAIWAAYLLLLAIILIFVLPRLNAALNVITERIPPHI